MAASHLPADTTSILQTPHTPTLSVSVPEPTHGRGMWTVLVRGTRGVLHEVGAERP